MIHHRDEVRIASYTTDNSKLVLDIQGGTLTPGRPLIIWGANSPPSLNQL